MLQPVSKPEVAVPRYLPRILFAHVVTERSIEYNLRVQVRPVVTRVASAPASHRAYRPAARERRADEREATVSNRRCQGRWKLWQTEHLQHQGMTGSKTYPLPHLPSRWLKCSSLQDRVSTSWVCREVRVYTVSLFVRLFVNGYNALNIWFFLSCTRSSEHSVFVDERGCVCVHTLCFVILLVCRCTYGFA